MFPGAGRIRSAAISGFELNLRISPVSDDDARYLKIGQIETPSEDNDKRWRALGFSRCMDESADYLPSAVFAACTRTQEH